jgi:two-component system LytT family response regulator
MKILIADDEALARGRLRRLASALEGIEVIGEAESGADVIAAVGRERPDVLLLDIEMPGLTGPGLSGIDAIAFLPEPRPYVIFCTAHAQHAVQAFEIGAVDYLLKPIDAGRLRLALERAARAVPPKVRIERLPIDTREGIVLLDPLAITHAELGDALVSIHDTAGRSLLTTIPLGALEERLPNPPFLRVHRRALLNLDLVDRLEPLPTGGFHAIVRTGLRVEVSRQVARELRRALDMPSRAR